MRFEQRKQNFRASLMAWARERLGRALRVRLLGGILKAKRQQDKGGRVEGCVEFRLWEGGRSLIASRCRVFIASVKNTGVENPSHSPQHEGQTTPSGRQEDDAETPNWSSESCGIHMRAPEQPKLGVLLREDRARQPVEGLSSTHRLYVGIP
jgi:hypothetical protein